MKRKTFIIISVMVSLALTGGGLSAYLILRQQSKKLADDVEVYETTGTKSKLLARQNNLPWEDYVFNGNTEVTVDPSETKGNYEGVGVAMTHSSAYLLETADESVRIQALDALFGSDGARLNVVRVPIGTSDYTYTDHFYSLDDVAEGAEDLTLSAFSTAEDERYLIPALQDILAINPEVQFIGVPWSAPAWMKTNGNLVGGQIIGSSGNETTPQEDAFARYLVKTIAAYDTFGIHFSYLSICNEPTITNVNYPSMVMNTVQYLRILDLVDQHLDDAGLDTKLMIYDHNVGSDSDRILYELFAEAVADDTSLKSRISGVAFHGYGTSWNTLYPDILTSGRETYPDWAYYLTEITESQDSVDFAANMAWTDANITIGPAAYGSSMAVYWNAILDDAGQPVLGNTSVCYGLLSMNETGLHQSASYYALAHISSFVYPVSGKKPVIVDAYSDNETKIKAAAFRLADGHYVYVMSNQDATTYEDVNLVMDQQMVTYRIQPQSTVTLVAPVGEATTPDATLTFTQVEVRQQTIGHYVLNVAFNESATAPQFYMTDTAYFAADTPLTSTPQNGGYTVSVNHDPGEFYLWVTDGSARGVLAYTLPSLAPRVTLDDGVATLFFNLAPNSSWSSFCDPYGKNVYRSAHDTFDDQAEQVNVDQEGQPESIYILADYFADDHYDAAKPYYYLVMDGKNGMTRYISGPVLMTADFVENPHLGLSSDDGRAILSVRADDVNITDPATTELVVQNTAGETLCAANESSSGLLFNVDISALGSPDVWYDILFKDLRSGATYDIAYDAVDISYVTSGNKRFSFHEWNGFAKIAYEGMAFTGAVAALSLIGGIPTLTVSGSSSGTTAALKINVWNGSANVNVISGDPVSVSGGTFIVSVPLGALNEMGTYYDVLLSIDGIDKDLTAETISGLCQTVTSGSRTYAFRSWQNLLKIAYTE